MDIDYEVAIIGGGPAGLTAGIYAQRSGVNAIIFDDGLGGIVSEAPVIENYPGFKKIGGMELADKIRKHAGEYVEIKSGERVESVELGDKNKDAAPIIVTTAKQSYNVKALILATGTSHRKLGIPGETEFKGRGVSYCATCDGFFFKNRKVAVIGGGNTAVMEALYLHGVGATVSIIHRRDQLRAEEFLCKECVILDIPVVWDTVVEEIVGSTVVEGLRLKNIKTGETTTLDVDGVFISVGELPQNKLAEQLGVELNKQGYVQTDRNMRTNVRRVYAAGDLIGGVRQIVTACAEGATAALTCLEVLGKQYPY